MEHHSSQNMFALHQINMTEVDKRRCLAHAHIVDAYVALFESQKMAIVTDNIL